MLRIAHRLRWFCACLLTGLMLWGCQGKMPFGESARVAQALSGDAIAILGSSGLMADTKTVHLLGIDAPGVEQSPWGMDAQKRLQQLVAGKTVRLQYDIEKQDVYGDRLAYVWLNDKFLNQRLVEEGYALAVPRPPNLSRDRILARAQEKARILGRGLWNSQKPLREPPTS